MTKQILFAYVKIKENVYVEDFTCLKSRNTRLTLSCFPLVCCTSASSPVASLAEGERKVGQGPLASPIRRTLRTHLIWQPIKHLTCEKCHLYY